MYQQTVLPKQGDCQVSYETTLLLGVGEAFLTPESSAPLGYRFLLFAMITVGCCFLLLCPREPLDFEFLKSLGFGVHHSTFLRVFV